MAVLLMLLVLLAGSSASSARTLAYDHTCGGAGGVTCANHTCGGGVGAELCTREFVISGASKVCDGLRLAHRLVKTCETDLAAPSNDCCDAFFAVVGRGSHCLCSVSTQAVFVFSPLASSHSLTDLYDRCGGTDVHLRLDDVCTEATPPPPPSPAGEEKCPSAPHSSGAVYLAMWTGWSFVAVLLFVVLILVRALWRSLRRARELRAPAPPLEAPTGPEISVEEVTEDEHDDHEISLLAARRHLSLPAAPSAGDIDLVGMIRRTSVAAQDAVDLAPR